MTTSQKAVTPCGWGVKAGMVRVWVATKTMWSRSYTRAISERLQTDSLLQSWQRAIQIHVTLLYWLRYRDAVRLIQNW